MKRALYRIPPGPHCQYERFTNGLVAAGYRLVERIDDIRSSDVLILWNRNSRDEDEARRFESAGGQVLIVENGYLGRQWLGGTWLAISRNQHNGAGTWFIGGPERWDNLGVEIPPWRTHGEEIVILPQRGIGHPSVAMPKDWLEKAIARYPSARVRHHPGPMQEIPLENDLANTRLCVTWGSGAALKALLMGIHVHYDYLRWIGAQGADGDRLGMFRKLIWAMWRMSEIESGEAFRYLCES